MHGTKGCPWSSPFYRSCVVLRGPCLVCSTVWACVLFAAGFRRLLFSFFQEVYSEVFRQEPKRRVCCEDGFGELLVAVLVVPLAGVGLRAPSARLSMAAARRMRCFGMRHLRQSWST